MNGEKEKKDIEIQEKDKNGLEKEKMIKTGNKKGNDDHVNDKKEEKGEILWIGRMMKDLKVFARTSSQVVMNLENLGSLELYHSIIEIELS